MKRRIFPPQWLRLFLVLSCWNLAGWGSGALQPVWGQEWLQLRGAVHVRTELSGGDNNLEQIAYLASRRGVDVLVLGERQPEYVEYGLPFFRKLIFSRRWSEGIPSDAWLETYFAEINRVSQLFPNLIIIDGLESAPYYFWSGSGGTLTAHHLGKKMMAIGLGGVEAYRQLPTVGQANQVWHWTSFLSFWPLLGLVGIVLVRRYPSYVQVSLGILCLVCLVNNFPFTVPRWDPHLGDMGGAPYQYYIDHVNSRGGLAFWIEPEKGAAQTLEPMFRGFKPAEIRTEAHQQDLLLTQNYGGFTTRGGHLSGAERPGGKWDQVLAEFAEEQRDNPGWFVGVSSQISRPLEEGETVFLVRDKSRQGILEAMAQGRMYTVTGKEPAMRLTSCEVSTEQGRTLLGGLVSSRGKARLEAKIVKMDRVEEEVVVTVVKNGQVVAQAEGWTPMEFNHLDYDVEAGKRHFYRLMVKGAQTEIVANPIFVDGVKP